MWKSFLKWLNISKSKQPENQIEADCPKCRRFQTHEIKYQTYKCTVCGNEQPKDEALTREETSW